MRAADPNDAFWAKPGPNGELSAVEQGKILILALPFLTEIPFSANGYNWQAERKEFIRNHWKWQLRQMSGDNTKRIRHTAWDKK